MLRRILRSAKQTGNPISALDKFKEIFHYRKQYKAGQMTMQNSCSIEFYKILPFVVDGTDRDGNQLFTVRIKYYKNNIPQFDLLCKHLLGK